MGAAVAPASCPGAQAGEAMRSRPTWAKLKKRKMPKNLTVGSCGPIKAGSGISLHVYLKQTYTHTSVSWVPLSEMLGTRSLPNFRLLQVFKYLHMLNEISWGWDTSLNMKLIYVSRTPHTHRLKVIFNTTFNNFVHEKKVVHTEPSETQYAMCSIFYLRCHVNTLTVSSFGAFWISDFQLEMLNLNIYKYVDIY